MVTSAVEEMAEGGGESSGGKAGLQLPAPVILARTSPGGPFARGTIDAAHAKVPLVNSTGSTVAVARACLTRMADARTGLATMTVDTVLAAGVEKSQLLPGEATTIEIAGTIPAVPRVMTEPSAMAAFAANQDCASRPQCCASLVSIP
jgi:hypothetical protein